MGRGHAARLLCCTAANTAPSSVSHGTVSGLSLSSSKQGRKPQVMSLPHPLPTQSRQRAAGSCPAGDVEGRLWGLAAGLQVTGLACKHQSSHKRQDAAVPGSRASWDPWPGCSCAVCRGTDVCGAGKGLGLLSSCCLCCWTLVGAPLCWDEEFLLLFPPAPSHVELQNMRTEGTGS